MEKYNMSNYCKNCYELTEELENHKRWIKDYKQKLEDAEEFANAKITQCGNLIKQLNETFEQLEAYKMEAEEGKEINAELKAENKHFNDLLNQALKDYDKAVQTLTEIKEIVENSINCSYELSSVINEMYEIKEKISEVIE